MKNAESYISIIAAIVSVIATIITVSFSIWVYNQSQTEFVNIEIKGIDETKPVIITSKPNQNNDQVIISQPPELILYWQCLINNTGNRPVSIVSSSVSQIINESPHNFFMGPVSYQGSFDRNLAGINYPFTLDVGESKIILLKVGMITDFYSNDRIGANIETGTEYSFEEIRELLLNNPPPKGYAVVPNGLIKLDYFKEQKVNDNRIRTTKKYPKQQHYLSVRFKTGKGRVFEDDISYIDIFLNNRSR